MKQCWHVDKFFLKTWIFLCKIWNHTSFAMNTKTSQNHNTLTLTLLLPPDNLNIRCLHYEKSPWMNTQKWNVYRQLLYHFQVNDQYHNFQVFIHGVFGLSVCKLYSYIERCLIWMLYPYTIFVLHAVWMNTTKYEAFWEKLVCASAGCCFVPCTAARRCRFPIRDCQRTGQSDARTQYVEEAGFSTFHHP